VLPSRCKLHDGRPRLYGDGRNDRLTATGVVPVGAHLRPHGFAVKRPPDGFSDRGAVDRALDASAAAIDQFGAQELFARL